MNKVSCSDYISVCAQLTKFLRIGKIYSYTFLFIIAGFIGLINNATAEASISDVELDVMVNGSEKADRLKAFQYISRDMRKINNYEIFMPWLMVGASDADEEIRELAFTALTGIAYVHQNKNLITDDATRKKFQQVTLRQMESKDEHARKVATEFYTIALKPTEEDLINLLRSDESSVIKQQIITAVRVNGYESDDAKRALMETIGSPDRVGSFSAVVLSQMSQPPLEAIPLIVEQLENGDSIADDFLLKALVKYGSFAKPYIGRINVLSAKINSGEVKVQHLEYTKKLISSVIKNIQNAPDLTPEQIGKQQAALSGANNKDTGLANGSSSSSSLLWGMSDEKQKWIILFLIVVVVLVLVIRWMRSRQK